jgi:hypothetical protein
LDEQKEKLKSKLTEASLKEVYFLLYFLNKIDFNERVWLAKEVFNEDDLVQKAEYLSFSTINNFMRLLPNEKTSAILSNFDPTDIADKAKSSTVQQILWFLKYCRRDSSNINFVNSFLFALNKEGELAKKLKNAPFSTIKGIFDLLPSEKSSAIISKLKPKVIADKAKSSSAQSIMWFLEYCSRDPSNTNFAKSFLFVINKEGELTEKLKNADISIVDKCLTVIKKINPDLSEELNSSIAPYRLQICISSNLTSIRREICEGRVPIKTRRSIVNNLASKELSEPIRKLYSLSKEPLKVLGKLLDCVHQVAYVTDEEAVERIAQQIVNNIDLKAQEKYNPEQLSLLVKNAKKCNELAWGQLCSRILSELNSTDYIRIPFEKGSPDLIWEFYQYDEEKGQELANEIFKFDFNKVLDSSETEVLKLLLWNLLQINKSEVRSWIQNMEEDKFLSKVLSSSTHEAFRLLWNLYQIEEEKGKSVAQSLANNVLSDLTAIETKDIPLLGFFVFCNIKLELNIPIPSPGEIAEEIIKNQSLAELAFCLCFFEKEDDTLLKEFLKELGRRFFLNNLTFPPKEKIEKHPIETF